MNDRRPALSYPLIVALSGNTAGENYKKKIALCVLCSLLYGEQIIFQLHFSYDNSDVSY